MNSCIFSIQTVLVAILVFQYLNISEVDAESEFVGNWFNSVEKKFEVVQNEAEPEAPIQEVKQKKKGLKRKRRIIKKYKKKNNKPDHLHIPHEQRLDASNQDKAEYTKKTVRRSHKKREKERRFVKTLPKESNSSESDEVKRRKPVDIIVHIKMND